MNTSNNITSLNKLLAISPQRRDCGSSKRRKFLSVFLLLIAVLSFSSIVALAQVPITLTDKIYKGEGSIDLMKDLGTADLSSYLNSNGELKLGLDVNENQSGNESSSSIGIAIKEIELVITTSAGQFSFNDFYTNTAAMILESGSTEAKEYYTAFGQSGSSQLTGGSSDFDLGSLDDVITLSGISYEGTLLSATLNVTFLGTSTQGGENESFFDFSGGFEDFALLGEQDATILESADIGIEAAPTQIVYQETSIPAPPVPASSGAPAPPLFFLVALGALYLIKVRS